MYPSACVEVQGQLRRVGSVLPSRGALGSTSGRLPSWQVLLLADLSHLAVPVLNYFVRVLCLGVESLLIMSLHIPLCPLSPVSSYPIASICHAHCIHGDAEHRKWISPFANKQSDVTLVSSEASGDMA